MSTYKEFPTIPGGKLRRKFGPESEGSGTGPDGPNATETPVSKRVGRKPKGDGSPGCNK